MATVAATRPSRPGNRATLVDHSHRREGEDRRTDRERSRSRQRHDTVLSHEHARCDESVHGEDRCHDREPARHDNRPRVTAPRSDRRQHERCGGGHEGAHTDTVEVHPQRRHHHHAPEQPEHEHGDHRYPDEETDPGDRCTYSHSTDIDRSSTELKGSSTRRRRWQPRGGEPRRDRRAENHDHAGGRDGRRQRTSAGPPPRRRRHSTAGIRTAATKRDGELDEVPERAAPGRAGRRTPAPRTSAASRHPIAASRPSATASPTATYASRRRTDTGRV